MVYLIYERRKFIFSRRRSTGSLRATASSIWPTIYIFLPDRPEQGDLIQSAPQSHHRLKFIQTIEICELISKNGSRCDARQAHLVHMSTTEREQRQRQYGHGRLSRTRHTSSSSSPASHSGIAPLLHMQSQPSGKQAQRLAESHTDLAVSETQKGRYRTHESVYEARREARAGP